MDVFLNQLRRFFVRVDHLNRNLNHSAIADLGVVGKILPEGIDVANVSDEKGGMMTFNSLVLDGMAVMDRQLTDYN